MYAGKHHLYNIALQQIIGLMLRAIGSTGESGEKQFLFPWKSDQDNTTKTVAKSNLLAEFEIT